MLAAKTIDFECKEFQTNEELLQKIAAFLDNNEVFTRQGSTVRVSFLLPKSGQRQTKADSIDALNALVKSSANKVWAKGDFVFDFEACEYTGNGIDLVFTAQEQLALYQKLVMRQCDRSWYAIRYNIRKRYGRDFMEEYL